LKKVLVTLLGAPIVIRRPLSLRPAQHFLIDVQSSTEKQNARSNARPPAELRWKAVFVILILRNKQYYRVVTVLIRVRHIRFSQGPRTTLIRPWTFGNVSKRTLCLQQSAPACGLTHSCVTMLSD